MLGTIAEPAHATEHAPEPARVTEPKGPNQRLRTAVENMGLRYEDVSARIRRTFPGRHINPNQLSHIFRGRTEGGIRRPPQRINPEALYMLLVVLNLTLEDVGLTDDDEPFVADALRGRRCHPAA